MKHTLELTGSRWSYGSYVRSSFRTDIIYTVLQYKEMDALYNRNLGRMCVRDGFAEQMVHDRLITSEMKEAYEAQVIDAFDPLSRFDHACIEDIYGVLYQERKNIFGIELIEKEQYLMAQREVDFDSAGGIDQTRKKDAMLESCKSVIFVLTDASLFFLMKRDMDKARKLEKHLYVLAGQEPGDAVPSRNWMETLFGIDEKLHYLTMESRNSSLNLQGVSLDEELQNQIDNHETFLIVYGEDGLLSCKDLLIDSVVYGIPSGYFTRTMTNQHGINKGCVVYIPARFDVTCWVSILGRTRVSYWQLSRLWEAFGDEIYDCTPDELYLKYPQYFLNVYADGSEYEEAAQDYPIQLSWIDKDSDDSVMRRFDQIRDQAIKEYLNRVENIQYVSTYFNEAMEQTEIPWHCEERQNGILVHAIRTGKIKDSYVVNCGGKTIRNVIRDDPKKKTVRFLSNFLFFLTPRLTQLYNELRKDQQKQQIDFCGGHLDYMLYHEDGKRIETFPLFRKACIGMTKSRQYLFFHFQLGGGSVTLNGETIRWEQNEVNPDIPERVAVYTPFYAMENEHPESKKFKMQVGENRINIVMIQNNIICIRKGSVILSSIGVIISMEETLGERFLKKLGARSLEDGYFECENYDIQVILDKPEDVTVDVWDQIQWVYGGGLSLIMDGKGLCDGGKDDLKQSLSEEGWLSVLSRQTQESAIDKMVKHPRTGIGITRNGDLVIIVYSGRTALSAGADYHEMIQIARKLYPDIWNLMNVDGGGSSFLGVAIGNSFMELSFPATSAANCAGMVRPVNTILCLESQEELYD